MEQKYPYEVKYSKENIWIWEKPNLGHWKLNKEQRIKARCDKGHDLKKKCKVEGCKLLGQIKGKCENCGKLRRKTICQYHRNEKNLILRGHHKGI